MGMSTHLMLLRDPNTDRHKKMVAAVKALKDAGISDLPEELQKYFGCYEVFEVEEDGCLEIASCSSYGGPQGISGISQYKAEMREGFDIRIKDLPKDVDIIRVFNSY